MPRTLPKFANCWAIVDQSRPKFGQTRPTSANFGQSWPEFGRPNLAKVRQLLAKVAQNLANFKQSPPALARFGPIWADVCHNSAIVFQILSNLGNNWPTSGHFGHIRAKFGRLRPKFGQCWANFAHILAPGQLLDHFCAAVGQPRSGPGSLGATFPDVCPVTHVSWYNPASTGPPAQRRRTAKTTEPLAGTHPPTGTPPRQIHQTRPSNEVR